jgi:hypothetical protein
VEENVDKDILCKPTGLLVNCNERLYDRVISVSGYLLHSFTQFYTVLHSFTQFYTVLHSFTQFYTVLHSFTQFYIVFHL